MHRAVQLPVQRPVRRPPRPLACALLAACLAAPAAAAGEPPLLCGTPLEADALAALEAQQRAIEQAIDTLEEVKGKGVSITGVRSNAGWRIVFHLAEWRGVERIRYRFDDDPRWYDTGTDPVIDPRTGHRGANLTATLPDAWITPGVHRFEVEVLYFGGESLGPVVLPFDFEAEALRWAKHEAERLKNRWVSFWDRDDRKRSALLFTSLTSWKDSLAEIRYSLDDCGVGERFPVLPWTELARPPAIGRDEDPLIRIPFEVQYACVQLVWRDGETSEVRRYEHATARQAAAAAGP